MRRVRDAVRGPCNTGPREDMPRKPGTKERSKLPSQIERRRTVAPNRDHSIKPSLQASSTRPATTNVASATPPRVLIPKPCARRRWPLSSASRLLFPSMRPPLATFFHRPEAHTRRSSDGFYGFPVVDIWAEDRRILTSARLHRRDLDPTSILGAVGIVQWIATGSALQSESLA